MKVSILVPIYGVEKFIERCAISLFEQTYENIEYIFVDDCTPDKSMSILRDVIEKYPNRKLHVKIIRHNNNQGLAAARLSGLQVSTGEYVWFVDSDDWVEKNAIESCLAFLLSGVDLVYFNYNRIYNDGVRKRIVDNLTIKDSITRVCPPAIWKAIYKRSIFFDFHIFPIVGLNFSEDYIVTARYISVVKKIHHIDRCLYNYNCENLESYWHNIKVPYLEQAAKGAIIVAKFYNKRNKKEFEVKKALIYSLASVYNKLYMKDSQNQELKFLLQTMFEISPFLGGIFSRIFKFYYINRFFLSIIK